MIVYTHKVKGLVTIGKECIGVNHKSVLIDASGYITIGNGVVFSVDTCIYSHEHYMNRKDKTIISQSKKYGIKQTSLIIGDDVYFGAKCIILPQVTNIPKGVIIGAGSVLTKNPTGEYEIWAGNPAKKVGERK